MFKNKPFLLKLHDNLDDFGFSLNDTVQTLYMKYFRVLKV
jgi:hypothetical protein